MYTFAILIGIYSYFIFFFGITHFLYPSFIKVFTEIFAISLCLIFYYKNKSLKISFLPSFPAIFIFFLICSQILINLIGALGPELAFDALWYHLTLPKIFLENHKIFHIPGGLFYYSDMPKLGEMLYIGALSVGSEINAKIIHFFFGIFCSIVVYKIARKYLSQLFSLLCVLIFFTNLVINFESITAYIDLIRTFFEILAVYAWIEYIEFKKQKYFYLSALLIGLAITTKLLAFNSFFIILSLSLFYELKNKTPIPQIIKKLFIYILISLSVPLPWFIFSYVNTYNPLYPFFTPIFQNIHKSFWNVKLFNPLNFLITFWNLFTYSSDPISPFFIGFLPILIFSFRYLKSSIKYLIIYSVLGLLSWYGISTIEGSRLVLPYIVILIIPLVLSVQICNKKVQNNILIKSLFIFVCMILVISIGYRLIANKKYIPYVLGRYSKALFLTNHLNFGFGDFYDTDSYFATHIKKNDLVVLIGFHNEYYVDFPAIDSSYIHKGQQFDYIAVQTGNLPSKYTNVKLQYQNFKTQVKLYYLGNTLWEN